MNLQKAFNNHFSRFYGYLHNHKLLCAVSGGPDSMVMLDLLRQLNLTLSVAHCNYKLRGKESDQDEQLVNDYCKHFHIPIFIKTFDTKTIAGIHKTGIQETARKLRYDWFNELLEAINYDYITTAHHADDNAETILFNIIRGTGMSGASGIPVQNNRIVRPLLNFSKKDLTEYAFTQQIPFRTDSSNHHLKYARNIIRNQAFPVLQKVNASAIAHINAFGQHCKISEGLIQEKTKQLSLLYLHQSNSYHTLDCKELLLQEDYSFWLFELLKPWGCNKDIVDGIVSGLLEHKTGSSFYTYSHRLVLNRQQIIIHPLSNGPEFISLKFSVADLPTSFHYHSNTIHFEEIPAENINTLSTTYQCIDLGLAGEEFTLRNWQPGDRFYPLGMNNSKKLSDYFTDKKMSIPEKECTLVLENDQQEIIAIIGHQISNNFRLTSTTNRVLRITLK